MNPLFLRSATEPNSKPNLEKVHKLVKNGNPTIPKNEDKMKHNIPNNWIYSENAAKQVWEDIEKSVKVNYFDDSKIEENPFKKIDEAASRIRQTIANYEIQDQDLLMQLLDALDEESTVDNLDQESLLTEARSKLLQMITDHVDNADEQKNMLDSLRFWFTELQRGKSNDDPDFKPDKFDAQSLLDFLRKFNKQKEESAENALNIHSDIVSMLMNRINEIQKTLEQKEFLLLQGRHSNPNPIAKPKAGRRANISRASIDFDKELTIAQRKIAELQSQVVNLKQALIEYARPTKEGEEKSSIGPLISLEKEFELDQKISVLTDEIKTLKNNNKFLQTQIGKDKQYQLVLENKLSNADKAKKTMEQNLQSMNQKMEQMEAVYQEKIKSIRNEAMISKETDGSSSLVESQKYQKKIQEMNQIHQDAIQTLMKENERRFRQQMKELTSAYESGDQSKILSSTVENYNNEIKNLREQTENQLKTQKEMFTNQLMELSSNYEKIIARKEKEKEVLKESFDSTLKAAEITSKMNFEDEERKKLFELNEKQTEELVFMRVDFTKKIDDLKRKLDRAVHERDTLKNLIETSAVSTLLDELNFDEDIVDEEEEEEKNEEQSVHFKSLLMIKQRELEKDITDKYLNIIDNQKKVLKDVFDWEIEKTKSFYQSENENKLSDFREQTVSKIQQLYKKIPESETTLEDLLSTIIKQLSNNEQTTLSNSMISINEVEFKMDELRNKLIDLESENHVWKRMFDKLGSDFSTAQREDIFNAFKDSIKDQTDDQIEQEEDDKNLLSRQATENKISPQTPNESNEKNSVPKTPNEASEKKTTPKTSTRRKPKLSKTMPRVIIHYSASSPANNSAQQFTQSPKIEKSPSTRTPKKKENQICCPECSCNYEYQQNQIKQKLFNVSYVSCPECSSQYNIKFSEVFENKKSTPKTEKTISNKSSKVSITTPKATSTTPNATPTTVIVDSSNKEEEIIESPEFLKKLHEAEEDAVEMRKVFIEYSLRIINMLKKGSSKHSNRSNESPEKTKKIKYDTCFDISKKISDFNIAPQGTLKMSNTDILARLKDREIHPPDPDQLVEQLRSLLMQLSNIHLQFTARNPSESTTENSNDDDNNKIISNKISSQNIEQIKKFQQHFKKEIKDEIKPIFFSIAENTKKLIEEHDSIIKKLKDSYVNLSKKSAEENMKNKEFMNHAKSELIKEREENKKNKEMIRKNFEVIETLESKLNDSISKLQQIAIQNEVHERNIAAFNQIEEEGKKSIDSMTEMILRLKDIIHKQEKEIDNLGLKNQSLEATIELFNTGRNCKLSRDFTFTIIHYPETEDELAFVNNIQIPQISGVSNLNRDFSSQNSANIMTPGSVKSERIRCRVTNNNNNNNSRPQSAARVFVPAKNKTSISKTPRNQIPTVDVMPLYAENYEQVTNKDNDDGNSSIVVYVTPFIKEKQHQLPKGAPGLVPSNPLNPNPCSQGNNNYISNTSFFSIQPGKSPLVSVMNNDGSSSNSLVSERLPLKENEVNTSYFKQCESRIRSLEKQLLDMQKKFHLEKDKTHEANQALFKAGIQNQKAVREIKKQMIYKENAAKGMAKAISMVSERDRKIKILTDKITKFNKIAASISDKIDENEKEKKSEIILNEEKGKKVRKYVRMLEETNVDQIYEKIMKSLNNNQIFSAMAQNEMKTIVRIQQLRKKAIEQEQNRIMGALDAMCFLTQPPMRPASTVKVTSTKPLTPKKPIMKKSIYVPINTKT